MRGSGNDRWGDSMDSNNKQSSKRTKSWSTCELSLPSFQGGLEDSMSGGRTFQVEGTNVIRVPFGVRQPRKKRPDRPETWATLVLSLHPQDNPTPPQAA